MIDALDLRALIARVEDLEARVKELEETCVDLAEAILRERVRSCDTDPAPPEAS